MRSRNLITLAIVLGVLIIIYLVQTLGTGKKSVSDSLVNIFPDFNSSSVSYIKVFKQDYPDSGLSFAKKDGKWLLSSYFNAPAKVTDIDKLLDDVNKLQGEIRSTKSDLFPDYEIADEVALHMEFMGPDSTDLANLLIGKGVPQASQASFARKSGSDTVYMANVNFLSRFAVWNAEPAKRMPGKRWTELKMAEIDKDKIGSFEIKVKKKDYLFEKKEEISQDTLEATKFVWQQIKPAGDKLKEDQITGIVGRLTNLRANDIVGNEILPEYKLSKPDYVVSITSDEGLITSIDFGAETDTTGNMRYAMVEGQPYIYTIAKYNFESIFVTPFKKD